MAVWQGVNQGLRAGLAIAGQINDQERQSKLDGERAEDRTYQRGLQAAQSARLEKQDKRQEGQDAILMADSLGKDSQREIAAAALSGGLSNDGRAKVDRLRGEADELRSKGRKLLGYEQKQQEAHQIIAAIDAGTPLDQIPDDKFGDAVSYITGHRATNFLDGNDGPSAIGKAYTDFSTGMESGDMDAILSASNTLLRPEIEQGTGQKNAKGETIIGKRMAGVYPSARDPKNKGVMDLMVTAQKADGTTYEYPAWMTKGRGPAKPEGGDEHEFDIQPAMDRINAYGNMLGWLHDPSRAQQVQKKITNWKSAGGEDQWNALRAEFIRDGGEGKDFDAMRPKTTHNKIDLKDRVIDQELDESGKIISEKEYRTGAAPEAPGIAAERAARAKFFNERPRTGMSATGGAPGGKRGEYLDLVGSALLPDEQDVNVRRRQALEYMKRDPIKAAQTMAAAIVKSQENSFGDDKLSYEQALTKAINTIQQESQGVVSTNSNTSSNLPETIARPSAAPPAGAVQMLRSNPKLAAQFDQKYGQGASRSILGGK